MTFVTVTIINVMSYLAVINQQYNCYYYYDELEVCNPLGSKRTKHKLGKILREEIFPLSLFKGAFYFNIGNVHPKFRQRLSNIKLLALTKSAIINEHGINEVMKCIVEDIKKLENVS